MKPLISIIVPVYNVQEYLNDCIKSLVSQSYKNLEIILVNDGSTDESGGICDEFAKKDLRIKVIHKRNGGLSSARNAGLDEAKGEFISFIDSDDIVSEDFIEALYALCDKFNVKMSFVGLTPFKNLCEIKNLSCETADFLYDAKDIFEKICLGAKGFSVSVCKTLTHKEIYKNIRFPHAKLYEDVFVAFNVFENAKKIAVNQKPRYFYRIREDSIVNSDFNAKYLEAVENVKEFASNISNAYPELESAAKYTVCASMASIAIKILKSKNKEFYSNLKTYCKFIRSDLKQIFFIPAPNFYCKITIIALGIHPVVLNMLLSFYAFAKRFG